MDHVNGEAIFARLVSGSLPDIVKREATKKQRREQFEITAKDVPTLRLWSLKEHMAVHDVERAERLDELAQLYKESAVVDSTSYLFGSDR
jgi:hypothetical protein